MYNGGMQTRNTNQRKLIMDIMNNNYSHPTADEIYEKARAADPHISRGTVYRNLAILSESGSIAKITVPEGADHYDCTTSLHYHFCCSKCGKMFDAPDGVKVETEAAAKEMEKQGFAVNGHNLIFFGLCSVCNGQN